MSVYCRLPEVPKFLQEINWSCLRSGFDQELSGVKEGEGYGHTALACDFNGIISRDYMRATVSVLAQIKSAFVRYSANIAPLFGILFSGTSRILCCYGAFRKIIEEEGEAYA